MVAIIRLYDALARAVEQKLKKYLAKSKTLWHNMQAVICGSRMAP
jgi:hypothetical protein